MHSTLFGYLVISGCPESNGVVMLPVRELSCSIRDKDC